MVHHDARDYNTAASEAARAGREKMEAIIAKGQASALSVFDQVQAQVPVDRIATAKALSILPAGGDGFELAIPGVGPTALHEHALWQVVDKAGRADKDRNGRDVPADDYKIDTRGPRGFLQDLRERNKPWATNLFARNLNTLLQNSESRHLIRTVNDQVRGFLSDRFRRLDARPLLDAFMGACKNVGAIPVDGYALDTKVQMRAVLPYVFEPTPNEVMLFGVQWGNSDFGDGSNAIAFTNLRLWCTNKATIDEVLRQVHLGKRLDDNIEYSQQTYELDTKANASALTDVVHNVLAPNRVNHYLELIKEAAEEKVGEKDVLRILKERLKLNKGEAEKVRDLFEGPDVINLPEGRSTYRLSNAVSFFAQADGISPHRRLDLERAAGDLLPKLGLKAREV